MLTFVIEFVTGLAFRQVVFVILHFNPAIVIALPTIIASGSVS